MIKKYNLETHLHLKIYNNNTFYLTSNITRLGAQGCIDWYLVTTIRDESGQIIDQYEVYLGTTCPSWFDESYVSLCSWINESAGGGLPLPIARMYTKQWQAIVVSESPDAPKGFGIYKGVTFTVEGEWYCTNLGFNGDPIASNSAPKGLYIEQISAGGTLAYAGDRATTNLKVLLYYPAEPVPVARTGSKDWTLSEMIK